MSDLTDHERLTLAKRYEVALHAMQTGVLLKMHAGSGETTPKHLRVGVNAAMSDQGALAQLLIAKGVITEREYYIAMAEGMEREAASYQDAIQSIAGSDKVNLG